MDYLQQAPITQTNSTPVTAAGTTTTLSTTNRIDFCIRSKSYTKAALSNTATPTTDIVTGAAFIGVVANKGSIYVLGLNHSGAIVVAQGGIQALDTSGNFIDAPLFPALPDDFCPFAYLVIKAGATANNTTGWIFGTSNNSSVTGITYAFQDIAKLPDRLQVA